MLSQHNRILLFFAVHFSLAAAATVDHRHHRRFLHQPFFHGDPTISQPPSVSPSPQPKYPFTSSSTSPPNDPTATGGGSPLFFPFFTSPPPPPAKAEPQSAADSSAGVSFPANISSLVLPTSDGGKKNGVSVKLVSLIVSLSLFSVLVVASAVFVAYRHRRHHPYRRQPLNAAGTDTNPGDDGSAGASSTAQKQTIRNFANQPAKETVLDEVGSPELHPLPPLTVMPLKNYYTAPITATIKNPNKVVCSMNNVSAETNDDSMRKEDDERLERRREEEEEEEEEGDGDGDDDEFFSPRTTPLVTLNNANERCNNNGLSKYKGKNFINPSFSWETPSPQTHSDHHQYNLNAYPLSPSLHSGDDSVKSPDYPFMSSTISRPSQPPPPTALAPFSPTHTDEETNTLDCCSPRPSSCFSVGPMPPSPANGPPELAPPTRGKSSFGNSGEIKATTPKLKPSSHWDKVIRVSQEKPPMAWDPFKKSSNSFQMDEETIEALFTKPKDAINPKRENHIIDQSKSQDIAILLRALNVTMEEVCESLIEGNADILGSEFLESLLKMKPTEDEELKLRNSNGESIGIAETLLKSVLEIPFAFERIEAMLYVANFESELEHLKRSFDTVESACKELKASRMFRKVLEAVLKTGNEMNLEKEEASAFKLDKLTKLIDVKGSDGKSTLLHFVVQEITRVEGARLFAKNANQSLAENSTNQQISSPQDELEQKKLGLQVVSQLSAELANVKKAASMDSDSLVEDVESLFLGIRKVVEALRLNEALITSSPNIVCLDRRFSDSMNEFLKRAEAEIEDVQAREGIALSMVKGLTEFFHGDSRKEEGSNNSLRIFEVVRGFLGKLDGVCRDIGKMNERALMSSARDVRAGGTISGFR